MKLGRATHEIIWIPIKIAAVVFGLWLGKNVLEGAVGAVVMFLIVSAIEKASEKRYAKTLLEETVETRRRVDKQMGREPDAIEKLVDAAPKEPTKKGKTPEQYAAAMADYDAAMRLNQIAIKKAAREKAVAWGCIEYTWLAFGSPRQACSVARKYDGETFSYANPPPEGHPGEGGTCTAPDGCKCWASPSYMIAD